MLLVHIISCTTENKKTQESTIVNVAKDNRIPIPNILKNDKIASDALYDLKYIELKGYKKKDNPISSRIIKVIGDRIYLHDFKINELYCFDFNGVIDYYIDFGKCRVGDDEQLQVSSFFINNGKLKVIDDQKALLVTFDRTKLANTKKFATWAPEVEALDNNNLIVFQGYVNNTFGAPYYFIKTDTNLKVKNKYLAVSETDLKASLKIGTVQNHIFHTDKTTNLLRDQENSIYSYPDFIKPAYKVDFGAYNINMLNAMSLDLPAAGMYNYARVKSFWESNKYILIAYSFSGELGYIVYNKENRKVYNNYRIRNLNDMVLFGVLGVQNDSYFTFVENDQITELLKVKGENRGFLKPYLENRIPTNSNPVLVFFKLRNI